MHVQCLVCGAQTYFGDPGGPLELWVCHKLRERVADGPEDPGGRGGQGGLHLRSHFSEEGQSVNGSHCD